MSADQFYLQDSRSYVGNDMQFWKAGGGYTTDVSKARIYTKQDAVALHQIRETDIPWPKDYIDARTRPAVDMQYVKRDEALAGTGIELTKPKRYKPEPVKCCGCGRFIKAIDQYDDCRHCGVDNRP
ncbi:MAG: hypothetical protein JWQ01_4843 [Massilia sp.]|nr:hypothetical protein [Massilia sp.]